MLSILKQEAHSSFSDIWYRVGPTRPRVSPHTQIIRQTFGPHVMYVVEDPAAGNYYRLTESAYFFVGLLDGSRTVDEAWDACNAQLGDEAPTQRECVDLLGKLQRFGLLIGELPLAADMVSYRREESAKARFQRQTGRLFTVTIPLVNPERFLERVAPLLRVVFSRWGMAVWVIAAAVGLWAVVPRWRELSSSMNGVLDPSNLPALSAMFLVIRAWHEFGHAMACKAMGGRCTQIGILLIMLVLPLPFCDASSSSRFPQVWRRVVVSAGGMLVEVFAASLAAVIWAYSEPGLVKTLAYNAMVVSGVATLVFNANPLLRYDGYYILSDVAGTPNLAQRSRELWRFLFERVGFGLRNLKPPAVRGAGEAWFLAVYAALSAPYRIFITTSLLLFILPKYLTLGMVMGVSATAAWIVWPALKSVGYLASDPRLMGRRGRAIAVSFGSLATLAVLIGVVPFPAAGFGTGTIESAERGILRPEEDGFVRELLVHAGDRVQAGQAIARLGSIDLEHDIAANAARLEQARAALDEASTKTTTEHEVAQRTLAKARADSARALKRWENMVVRAPIAGVVCSASGSAQEFDQLLGRFVTRGAQIAEVKALDRLVVKALVSDLDQAYVFRGRDPTGETSGDHLGNVDATVRVRGLAGTKIHARILRVGPAGTRKLPNGSLSTAAGGDIILDPTDPKRERTIVPQFLVELEPIDPPASLRPGQRASVRLGIEPEPLLWQAWRRMQQYFTTRRET